MESRDHLAPILRVWIMGRATDNPLVVYSSAVVAGTSESITVPYAVRSPTVQRRISSSLVIGVRDSSTRSWRDHIHDRSAVSHQSTPPGGGMDRRVGEHRAAMCGR